jgi:hypothetical protein
MLFCFLIHFTYAQGYNHAWLLGYDIPSNMAKLNFTDSSILFSLDPRSMGFRATQGNISDANGNFIMSSNGIWIANKNNTMMLNGGGLNPNSFTNNWSSGLPISNGNIFLPWPNDTTKYVLFHQTGYYDSNYNLASRALYYSIIDLTGDNGLGEVIQKNTIILQDTLAYGLGACKHANGSDWWIVAIKDKSDIIFKFLLTKNGIQYYGSQQFNFPIYEVIGTQPTFSPDGGKFAFTGGIGLNPSYWLHDLRILDFDRCTGLFYNPKLIDVTDGGLGFSVAFSSNSKYLYISKFNKVMQLNTDTSDIAASLDTVAVWDGFISGLPPTCCATDFWTMYLAANGKIYLSSGSSVKHLHEMSYPDSGGVACDVQQHSINLNGIWHFRAVPNHPNYYLGCDTTLGCQCLVSTVGINEVSHDFRFNIYPNPSSGKFNIIYLLPQNKEGIVQIFDVKGRLVFSYNLPQWSTLQHFNLNHLAQGIYAVKISSDGYNVSKKIIITE